jgi:hypothetical protein
MFVYLSVFSIAHKRSSVIQHVGAVIDMDGFEIPVPGGENIFFCKEIGISYLFSEKTSRFTFQVGNFYDLLPRARPTVSWVMRNIHGMRFEDAPGDLPQNAVVQVLLAVQAECIVEGKKSYLAYKGGHHERRYLDSVGIPSFNLELAGCPRYTDLLKYYNVLSTPDCDLHCNGLPWKEMHCPFSEAILFRKWVLEG